jgi:NADH dehydrogenase
VKVEAGVTADYHVVIAGAGFGGLYAAKALRRRPVRVTLLDRHNYHLFQPLLYQVATGSLSPADIASPVRTIFKGVQRVEVLRAEVVDVDPGRRCLFLADGELGFDALIVATGVEYHYFGRDEWAAAAPGLKTLDDALEMRDRILLAFEAAEREPDAERRRALMTFVIVGGGPTGVELAGALGEIAGYSLRREFRRIDPAEATILLLEGTDRLLPTFPPGLSARAAAALARLKVTVRTNTLLADLADGVATVRDMVSGAEQQVRAETVLWAAGVRATPLGPLLARRTGAEVDRLGRIVVNSDLTMPGYPEVFVIGDLAHYAHQTGEPLPGVAQVAMQQGRYEAEVIGRRLEGKAAPPPFRYKDKGNLAVIGRNEAVADFGRLRLSGYPAWLIWVLVHIQFLIEYDNKLKVMVEWAWEYWARKQGARLITGRSKVAERAREGS